MGSATLRALGSLAGLPDTITASIFSDLHPNHHRARHAFVTTQEGQSPESAFSYKIYLIKSNIEKVKAASREESIAWDSGSESISTVRTASHFFIKPRWVLPNIASILTEWFHDYQVTLRVTNQLIPHLFWQIIKLLIDVPSTCFV